MKIKKNDTVLLLTGKGSIRNSRGESKKDAKTGKVLAVYPKTNKVLVEGVNIQTKHKKARTAQEVSEIKKQAGPVDASNVMVICPVCGKATRIGYQIEGDKKVRICKKCGKPVDNNEAAKAVKKTANPKKKATEETKTTKKGTKKSTKPATKTAAETTAEDK